MSDQITHQVSPDDVVLSVSGDITVNELGTKWEPLNGLPELEPVYAWQVTTAEGKLSYLVTRNQEILLDEPTLGALQLEVVKLLNGEAISRAIELLTRHAHGKGVKRHECKDVVGKLSVLSKCFRNSSET